MAKLGRVGGMRIRRARPCAPTDSFQVVVGMVPRRRAHSAKKPDIRCASATAKSQGTKRLVVRATQVAAYHVYVGRGKSDLPPSRWKTLFEVQTVLAWMRASTVSRST